MALPVYSTGTVSVAVGGTVVTGIGTLWSGTNVKQGDFISINNLQTVLVLAVTDTTHIVIPPWTGAAQTGVAYKVYQNYVGRVVGVAAAEDVGVMIEKLHTDGLPFIVDPTESIPDPSFGNNGQLAFKPDSGEWWTKTAGVWVTSPGLTGSDPTRVADTGDIMTGDLQISTAANPALVLNQTATHASNNSLIGFNIGGSRRWEISGAYGTESASNVGSDFSIDRYSNAGTYLASAIDITRSSGAVNIPGALTVGGTLTGVALSLSGNITSGGSVTTTVKQNLFGTSGGAAASAAIPQTDANIMLYNGGASNWNGMGADGSGNMWFRVGTSGTPTPAFYLQASDKAATFTGSAVTLTPPSGTCNLNFYVSGTRRGYINHNSSSFNFFSSDTGLTGMYMTPGATAWTSLSDARMPWKKIARPMTVLDKLDAVQLYEAQVNGRADLFVKAQEFSEAFPHLVKVGSGPDDYVPESMAEPAAWGMSYDRAGVVALQGLKEAMAVIEQLQARIAALEAAAGP